MKKNLLRMAIVILVSIMMIILTGCVKFRLHVTVNKDGTASMELAIVAHESMTTLGMFLGGDLLEEMKAGLVADGFIVEVYKENGMRGLKAIKNLESMDHVSIFGIGEKLDLTDRGYLIIQKGFFYTTYHLAVSFNLAEIYGEEIAMLGLLKPEMSFALSLPVQPIEHNADTVSDDGKTLEWNLLLGVDNNLNVSFRAPNVTSIVLALFIIFSLIIAVFIYIRKHKKG